MSQLSPDRYLEHLRTESARFREVLAGCHPAARVSSCPDWSAADLLWHLTEVQWFWGTAVIDRPRPVDVAQQPERPASYAETLGVFDRWSAALGDALEGVDPAAEAWTWSADRTVGFILRRQAHEALVHRLDAELTAGVISVLPPDLAADGVHEVLSVMYGGCPTWGTWTPLPHHLRLDCTDTGHEVWVQLGRFSGTDPESNQEVVDVEDLHVVSPPEGLEPDVVIDGPAGAMDAWLWHRGDESELSVVGDQAVLDRFRTIVAQPVK